MSPIYSIIQEWTFDPGLCDWTTDATRNKQLDIPQFIINSDKYFHIQVGCHIQELRFLQLEMHYDLLPFFLTPMLAKEKS